MPTRTDAEIIKAVTKRKGLVSVAAKSLGITRQTIYNRAKTTPEISEAIRDARSLTTDVAEEKLFDAIENGEAWAICFYLKCQAKDRGYVERQEVTGAEGGSIEIDVTEVQSRLTSRIAGIASRIGAGGVFDEPSGNGGDSP